jgi:virulence-associated protein VagC
MKGCGETTQEDGRVVDAPAARQQGVAATGIGEAFAAAEEQFSPDFMEERAQPGPQEREGV